MKFLHLLIKFKEDHNESRNGKGIYRNTKANIGAIKNGETDYNRTAKYIINEIKLEHIKGITFDYEK